MEIKYVLKNFIKKNYIFKINKLVIVKINYYYLFILGLNIIIIIINY